MFDNHYKSLVYYNDIAYEDVVYMVDIYPDGKLMDRNVDSLRVVLLNTFLHILYIQSQPEI
jgi:hypothetical protein